MDGLPGASLGRGVDLLPYADKFRDVLTLNLVSIWQHTAAYCSIRQHTADLIPRRFDIEPCSRECQCRWFVLAATGALRAGNDAHSHTPNPL